MRRLTNWRTGAYAVTTIDSTYVIDLDRKVVFRVARTEDPIGAKMPRDGEPIALVSIVKCALRQPMHLLLDLRLPGVFVTVRRSTPVVAIWSVEPIDGQ